MRTKTILLKNGKRRIVGIKSVDETNRVVHYIDAINLVRINEYINVGSPKNFLNGVQSLSFDEIDEIL